MVDDKIVSTEDDILQDNLNLMYENEFPNFDFSDSDPPVTECSSPGSTPLGSATSDPATEDIEGVGSVGSNKIDTRTFKVTLSPPGDISDEMVNWFLKTYQSNNKFVVCERGKSGQRHMHALLQFDSHKQRKCIMDVIRRSLHRIHPDSSRAALHVCVAYDLKWFEEYLRKEDGVENVDTNDFDDRYFRKNLPSAETQLFLQAKQGSNSTSNFTLRWTTLEKQWIEYKPDDASYESAVRFLKRRMFKIREMEPIVDQRRFCQLAYTLWQYRNKRTNADPADLLYFYRLRDKSQTEKYEMSDEDE